MVLTPATATASSAANGGSLPAYYARRPVAATSTGRPGTACWSLRAGPSVSRCNIYESIEPAWSSSALPTAEEDDAEAASGETESLLAATRAESGHQETPRPGCESRNEEEEEDHEDENDQDDLNNHSSTLGRRDPNADKPNETECGQSWTQTTSHKNIDLISEKQQQLEQPLQQQPLLQEASTSDPLNYHGAACSLSSLSEHQHHFNSTNQSSHDHCLYQVPTSSRAPTINDEINGLIEQKRTQTLELLRDKEAPRANTELASSLDLIEDQPESGGGAERFVPSQASQYENVDLAGTATVGTDADQSVPRDEVVADKPMMTRTTSQTRQMTDDEDAAVLSPSESSQNLNTLSLASEILDLSNQEENSLVQQLGGC